MADEKKSTKSEKATKGFENLAPLVGLAASIGTSIPGLKKAKRGSAAVSAARNTQRRAAGAVIGGSQGGFGASRGLALRSGLRAASNIAQAGAVTAAAAASSDEAQFQKDKDARNARLAQFGKDTGAAAAGIGEGIVKSRQADSAAKAEAEAQALEMQQEQAQKQLPGIDEVLGIDPATGLPTEAAALQGEEIQQELEPDLPRGLDVEQPDEAGEVQEPVIDVNDPEVAIGVDPLYNELGLAGKEALYSIAPELNLQLRQENYALDELTRQGMNIERLYAKLARLQNLPAVRALHQNAAQESIQQQAQV